MTGRTQTRPARRVPALSGPSPRTGANAIGSTPARMLPRLAAPTVRNEPMLKRCTRSAGRLCSTMNGGPTMAWPPSKAPCTAASTSSAMGSWATISPAVPRMLPLSGNQKDAAPPEEVREDPRGDHGQTVSNPVDGGELRDEERVVSRGEQVEI